MRFILTGGNASDARLAIPLLAGLDAEHVIADKAYDSHAILDHIEASGAQPVIPQRTCMPRKRAFDATKYKLRNPLNVDTA
ncbi:transposase [Xanthobacter sp. TB0136]|uniref:transposase n=1 Tax=Xanthobacter sp. TB0136 TaxID=3459177 RepID=UPI0040397A64